VAQHAHAIERLSAEGAEYLHFGFTPFITVTQATMFGDLRVYAAGIVAPMASVINYSAGHTRANNGVLTLGAAGDFVVQSDQPSGTVHVIIDLAGYFQ
jgi:hypothetical protein